MKYLWLFCSFLAAAVHAEPAKLEAQWSAQWIGRSRADAALSKTPDLSGASWIWTAEAGVDPILNAPSGSRYFQREIWLAAVCQCESATVDRGRAGVGVGGRQRQGACAGLGQGSGPVRSEMERRVEGDGVAIRIERRGHVIGNLDPTSLRGYIHAIARAPLHRGVADDIQGTRMPSTTNRRFQAPFGTESEETVTG